MAESGLDQPSAEPAQGRHWLRRRWPFVLAGFVGVVLLGYLGLAWWTTTRLPSGSTVSGVPVGGLGPEVAVDRLQERLGERTGEPLSLAVGPQSAQATPAELGLSLNYRATVDEALRFTLDPRVVISRLGYGEELRLPVVVDDAKLRAGLADLAQATKVEPVDGKISLAEGKVVRVEPTIGSTLDIDRATTVIRQQWPERTTLTLPVEHQQPAIDKADMDKVEKEFAAPAVAGPVTFNAGDKQVVLQPAQLSSVLKIDVRDGTLAGVVDAEALKAVLLAPEAGLGVTAENARFEFRDGTPAIVPHRDGVSVDAAVASEALSSAIAAPDRTAALATTVAHPELTTADLEGAGVKEVVSEFGVNMSGSSGRRQNIRIASETVNGTYLAPGETFSLNEVIGRRTADKGYSQAPVISGGRLRMGTGGGVSQVATTLFNGMFFAGLKDVEHKPHSFYISRYPEGREATVNYPNVDLKFTNDTPHGVLIEMWVGEGKVNTRFWSTKVWDITSEKSARSRYRAPRTIYDERSSCVAQSAQSGFDVTVTRIFSQGGVEKKRENFWTRYIPEDRVICGPREPADSQ